MKAGIIAVGSEMLGPHRLDTNSLLLTEVLERSDVPVLRKSVVGDDRNQIASELRRALSDCEIVIVTGGLGPTEDDVTRDGVSQACSLELVFEESILRDIEQKFTARGMRMPETNRRQAYVFSGQRTLPNRRGTAPGFHLTIGDREPQRHVWVLPGVPFELEGMVELDLEPWLKKVASGAGRFRRVVKVIGISESALEEKLAPFYESHRDDPLTILASGGEIQIHCIASGEPDQAFDRLATIENDLRAILGHRIYGTDGESLPSVVGRLLASRGDTIATAESCTGGLLGSSITDVSGSSAYFLGGVVAYNRDTKLFLLGIDPKDIDDRGEVSEEVAREMAEGARRRFSATWGLGITGIAGPTGGTDDKPVGTVHVAIAWHGGSDHRRFVFPPPRDRVKELSVRTALNMLRLALLTPGGNS